MKPDLHVKLVNDFELPLSYQSELDSYYLLHWNIIYFFAQCHASVDGKIEHNRQLFIPVFKSESFALDTNTQLRLSFRVTPIGSDIPNYVLVKAL